MRTVTYDAARGRNTYEQIAVVDGGADYSDQFIGSGGTPGRAVEDLGDSVWRRISLAGSAECRTDGCREPVGQGMRGGAYPGGVGTGSVFGFRPSRLSFDPTFAAG